MSEKFFFFTCFPLSRNVKLLVELNVVKLLVELNVVKLLVGLNVEPEIPHLLTFKVNLLSHFSM